MWFWAIEVRPGELLVDGAVVTEPVSRIVGITAVEALFLFTSSIALDGFMKGFLEDGEGSGSRRELEVAFEHELQVAGPPQKERNSGSPSSPRSLLSS